MKIIDVVHALILSDQKKIIPGKSKFKASDGRIVKFIRVDTKLKWPRLIVKPSEGEDWVLSSYELRKLQFILVDAEEIKIEPIFE